MVWALTIYLDAVFFLLPTFRSGKWETLQSSKCFALLLISGKLSVFNSFSPILLCTKLKFLNLFLFFSLTKIAIFFPTVQWGFKKWQEFMPWAAHHLLKMDLWPDMLNWRRERKTKVFFFVLQFSSFESLEIERNSVFPSIQALIRETDTLWRTKNAQWVKITKNVSFFCLAKICSHNSWTFWRENSIF